MCGIAGIVAGTGSTPTSASASRACATSSRIAGQTMRGCSLDDQAALGHRRLSIVDLAAGHQPLSNEDGTDLDRLQRRNLQPRLRPSRARSRRPSLQDAIRHRDDRPRLRAVGRRVRRSPARHVRLCDLGRAAAAPAAGARPPGRQAALLGDGRRTAPLRIGDQVDPRERPDPRVGQRGRPPGAAGHAVSLRRRDAVQRHPSAAARATRWSSRTARSRRARTGTSPPAASRRSSRGCPTATSSAVSASCSRNRSASA